MTDQEIKATESTTTESAAAPEAGNGSPFLTVGVRWPYVAAVVLALLTLPFNGAIVGRLNELIPVDVSRLFPLFILVTLTVPWVVKGYRKTYALITGVEPAEDEDADDKASNSKARARARRREKEDAGDALDTRQAHRAAVSAAGVAALAEAHALGELDPAHLVSEGPDESDRDEDAEPVARSTGAPPAIDPNESALVDHYA